MRNDCLAEKSWGDVKLMSGGGCDSNCCYFQLACFYCWMMHEHPIWRSCGYSPPLLLVESCHGDLHFQTQTLCCCDLMLKLSMQLGMKYWLRWSSHYWTCCSGLCRDDGCSYCMQKRYREGVHVLPSSSGIYRFQLAC